MNVAARLQRAASRFAGILSVGSGLALVVAPRATGRLYGLPKTPELCRALGARDVLIGLGLLASRRSLYRWWLGRTVCDAFDVALIAWNLPRPKKAARHDFRVVMGVALVGLDIAMTIAPRAAGERTFD